MSPMQASIVERHQDGQTPPRTGGGRTAYELGLTGGANRYERTSPAWAYWKAGTIARTNNPPHRYAGLCPRCRHETTGPFPGPTACKWGGCNGTPTLTLK